MSPADLDDAARDAVALIEASHGRDGEARRVILDHCDARSVAVVLAAIAAGLVGDLAEWCQQSPDAMFTRMREHHTAG